VSQHALLLVRLALDLGAECNATQHPDVAHNAPAGLAGIAVAGRSSLPKE
jgi:hypothetical protein